MDRSAIHTLKHAAIYLLARGLPGVIAFLAIPIFTRLLDPAAYGRFALVVATAGLFNAFFFQWMRLSLVRYLAAYKDDAAKLKSTLLTVELLMIGGTALIALVIYVLPADQAWRDMVWPCWSLLAALAAFELCGEHTRAAIRPWRYMLLQVARVSIWVALGCLLAVLGFGWFAPLAGMVVGLLVPVLYAGVREWSDARLSIDRKTLLAVARYGVPLSLTVALAVVIGSSDRFLIAALMNQAAAGVYSVASDLAGQTLTLLLMVVYLAMFPLAVRAWEDHGPPAARHQMRHNAALMLAIGIPATAAFCILAPNIAFCFLGPTFRTAATTVIPLVAIGALLAGLKAYHFDAAFQFAHRTFDQVWIVLLAAVVNVALNLVFIPRWGVQGAAAASVLAYLVSIALAASYGRRFVALPFPLASFAQVLVAAAAMAVPLWLLRNHRGPAAISVQTLTGGATYGIVLLSLNFLDLRTALLATLSRRSDALSVKPNLEPS